MIRGKGYIEVRLGTSILHMFGKPSMRNASLGFGGDGLLSVYTRVNVCTLCIERGRFDGGVI